MIRPMFTGLVEEAGKLERIEPRADGARLVVEAPTVARGLAEGASVAVNGCCLTAVQVDGNRLAFDLLRETLDKTNLGDLAPGDPVNLERALAANARLGGHFVSGHVDCTARVEALEPSGADHRLEVELPAPFAHYAVYKGSIAVDGISLTLAEVRPASFVCWIIPHTFAVTNLARRSPGSRVNLEFDLLAKYVERILARPTP
jgi:riboflavin synthase